MPRSPTLSQLGTGVRAKVKGLRAPAGHPAWQQQLEDLGFLPGEPVLVLRRSLFGGDRLVVRLGAGATIALRAAEAACVLVAPVPA